MTSSEILATQAEDALQILAQKIRNRYASLHAISVCYPTAWVIPSDFLDLEILSALGRYPASGKSIRLDCLLDELAGLHENIYTGWGDI